MKTTFTLLCAALLALPALAQEVPPPLPESSDEPILPSEPTLIPDEPAPAPQTYIPDTEPSSIDEPLDPRPEPKFSKTQASIEEMKIRVKLREARTKADRDPAVQEAKARSKSANTFLAKRAALGVYYDRLFMRMKNIDGSIRERIDMAHAQYRRSLLQPRINAEDAAIVNAAPAPAATTQ